LGLPFFGARELNDGFCIFCFRHEKRGRTDAECRSQGGEFVDIYPALAGFDAPDPQRGDVTACADELAGQLREAKPHPFSVASNIGSYH
jgi:hypothetical protein